jgi:hypothetical protein
VRVGRIVAEYEAFYLTKISNECSRIRIEEYQINLSKRNYDALIAVYADAREFPISKRAIQRNESIDSFESLGEISDRAFYEVNVDDADYARHPIRYLQNVTGAYFGGKIIPTEAEKGVLSIYGVFDEEEIFNKCVETLNEERGIDVHLNECESWPIDYAGAFGSIPTIFNALRIDPQRAELLTKALFGDSSSILYLGRETNLLDTLFTSNLLKDRKFLDTFSYIGMTGIVDMLKPIFWWE